MRAMIWLGLNCSFGCTDCGKLKWKDLDLKNGRVRFPRNKTGVRRNLPLWPETIQVMRKVPRVGQLVFCTSEGHPWVRTLVKTESNGDREYTSVDRITPTFSRLMKKVGIHAPKRTGFYALRRTAVIMAARS
ncbi:MAG: tyrosine-type recombinase/integrase [Planctomycetota bacterium]